MGRRRRASAQRRKKARGGQGKPTSKLAHALPRARKRKKGEGRRKLAGALPCAEELDVGELMGSWRVRRSARGGGRRGSSSCAPASAEEEEGGGRGKPAGSLPCAEELDGGKCVGSWRARCAAARAEEDEEVILRSDAKLSE